MPTNFAKHAYQTLKSNFDPTQIEKICFSLRERLETRKNTEEILDWFAIEFDTFKPQLRQQIDFLDRQIDHSVIELRQNKQLNLRDGDILETLKQIDARFDSIRSQNKELRSAFREIEMIKKMLEGYSNVYDDNSIDNHTYDAVSFFYEMRQTLSAIDKRLDRIQPKIKQLFSNLNKPLFNARVEKFLFHLIDKSEDKIVGNKKTLHLPDEITPPILWESWMNFTIVERRVDLFPVKAKKRIVLPENLETKSKSFLPFTEKLIQQDEITQWINRIVTDLETCSEVPFSPYFLMILTNGKENSLSLAIGVTYRALKFFDESSSYAISIHPEKLIANNDNTIFVMGNDNTKDGTQGWDFLRHPDAKLQFSQIDYALKNGKHIQRWKDQIDMFRFIEANDESLKIYYRDFFGVILEYGGEATDKYYYLDFMAESRGSISIDNRHFMANEHVLIGFMLYKVIYIDQYVELSSIKAFQKMVREDYEELKPGLYRALAKARREKTTELNDSKVDNMILSALSTFHKIGWIDLEGETFDVLPSFQRLPRMYGDYINDIDNLLKPQLSDESVSPNP